MKGGRTIQNNSNTLATSLRNYLIEEKKHSAQEERLANKTWGMGLEHETQFFYTPIAYDSKYPENEIVVMVTEVPAAELLKYGDLKESDIDFLDYIDFERTGRYCAGEEVLELLTFKYGGKLKPLKMPEFITRNPFSNLKKQQTIYNYVSQLLENERKYKEILKNIPYVDKFLDKNGLDMNQYPFGMASNIRVRKDYTSESPELESKHYQDYTGSYHFTVTLPFEEKESYTKKDEKEFVDKHYNFGAMFQWIEPLLLAAYFSCDQKAVGTNEKRIRGSFRVARVGWGNFAGSDMRKKTGKVGVGRYADVEPYWRDNLKFHESELLKPCRIPHKEEDQAISSFSSNIRTFGPDPNKPGDPKARISGAKMTIPNGMEIRIFDHFPTENLLSLLQIIILIAANSETVKVKDYVYQDKEWIDTMHKIMLEGWKAEVSSIFLKKLETVFDITTEPKSMMAYDVLVDVTLRLFEKNKNSDIVYLMYGERLLPEIPMINRFSWEMGFMLKLFEDKNTFNSYLKFVDALTGFKKVSDFQKCVTKYFGKVWTDNWIDILHFMKGKKLINLINNEEDYEINPKFLIKFITKEAVKNEIIIQLNIVYFLNGGDGIIKNKSDFFSYNQVKLRYKDFINIDNPIFKKRKS